MRILNRIVEWTDAGISYEADQRHAEIIVRDMGLQKDSKAVTTPSTAPSVEEDEEELVSEEAAMYRALVARANFIAQDRGDIAFTVKELCRSMSRPRHCDVIRLKRLARYLAFRPRVVIKFDYQELGDDVTVWTDTDHAGCLRTRKSTSGGVVMLGSHNVKMWSVNQAVIALSSGEAEYHGMVKGASTGLGIKGMLIDMGIKCDVVLRTDSSAAKGIASRRGLGRIRHMELAELWLQEKVATGTIQVRKVKGSENLADALTKPPSRDMLSTHMAGTSQVAAQGRHKLAPGV